MYQKALRNLEFSPVLKICQQKWETVEDQLFFELDFHTNKPLGQLAGRNKQHSTTFTQKQATTAEYEHERYTLNTRPQHRTHALHSLKEVFDVGYPLRNSIQSHTHVATRWVRVKEMLLRVKNYNSHRTPTFRPGSIRLEHQEKGVPAKWSFPLWDDKHFFLVSMLDDPQ